MGTTSNAVTAEGVQKRLELVRERAGYGDSLRAFARCVNAGGEVVSYEAARRYHADREPSLEYLARVASIFDVDLGWLVTGLGDEPGIQGGFWAAVERRRSAEAELREAVEEALREALGDLIDYSNLPEPTRGLILRTWQRFHHVALAWDAEARRDREEHRQAGAAFEKEIYGASEPSDRERQVAVAVAARVAQALRGVVGEVAEGRPGDTLPQFTRFRSEQLEDAAALSCQAVLALLPYSGAAPEPEE